MRREQANQSVEDHLRGLIAEDQGRSEEWFADQADEIVELVLDALQPHRGLERIEQSLELMAEGRWEEAIRMARETSRQQAVALEAKWASSTPNYYIEFPGGQHPESSDRSASISPEGLNGPERA